jgi:hypothetical protein
VGGAEGIRKCGWYLGGSLEDDGTELLLSEGQTPASGYPIPHKRESVDLPRG